MTMEADFKRARQRGVPMVFIRSSDQLDTARRITQDVRDRGVLVQDCTRGLTPGNKPGQELLPRVIQDMAPEMFTEIQTALASATVLGDRQNEKSILVCLGADRWLNEARPALAAMLLRDLFKANGAMLVCIGTAYAPAPELGSDIICIDDEPPTAAEREQIVLRVAKDARLTATGETLAGLLTYTRGLSGFSVEQTVALAANPDGFDMQIAERVWRDQINSVPGLRVMTERPSPDMVGGLEGWSNHVGRLANGRSKPEAIVFIDEIEKSLAGASGASGDSSGSSQQVLGRMLSEMEQTGARGSVFNGPPGTGKSLAASAAGSVLGIPTISFNPSDVKGSLVGETEKNATRALSVLRALAGKAYWIATCNSLTTLPPELLRRFTDGIWFFDLPSEKERREIWNLHLRSRGFTEDMRYEKDHDWTGADIRNVVRAAWESQCMPGEIAREYVPSSRASRDMIQRLRQSAVGSYRSAQYKGAYVMPGTNEPEGTLLRRAFDMEDS